MNQSSNVFGLILICVGWTISVYAEEAGDNPAVEMQPLEFNIAALPIGDALNEFAAQSGLQIVLYSDISDGLSSKPISGRFDSQDAAIASLLTSTDLSHEFLNDNTIAIQAAEQPRGRDSGKSQPASVILIAQAQTSAEQNQTSSQGGNSSESSEEADTNYIEEIMVTAQKREQSVQDVGIAITAFTGKQIRDLRIEDASQLAFYVPGLYTATSFGNTLQVFSIRGVTQNDFNDHGEAPTVVYMDDGYMASMSGQKAMLFDADRIEVLKGPQGTLFGRNATGGAVHLLSRKPSLDGFEGYASLGYGDYSETKADFAVNSPLSPTTAIRVSGAYSSNDGYYKNSVPGGADGVDETRWGLRGRLLTEFTNGSELLITGFVAKTEFSTVLSALTPGAPVLDSEGRIINVVSATDTAFGLGPTGPFDVESDIGFEDIGEIEVKGITMRLDIDFDALTFTSITDYKALDRRLLLDPDSSSLPIIQVFISTDHENWSQEFRVFLERERYNFTAGVYYLDIDAIIPNSEFSLPIFNQVIAGDWSVETQSIAGFAQGEYEINSSWTAVGGLRYTHDEIELAYQVDLYSFSGDFLNPRGSFVFPVRTLSGDRSEGFWTAKAQLEWRSNDGVLVYGGWNRGVKGGGFNAPPSGGLSIPDSGIEYDSETLDAFEIGFKSTLWNNRMRFNGAVFYYDYNDYQAFKQINLDAQVVNKDARTWGIELETTIKPDDNWTFLLSGSYLDNVVKDIDWMGIIRDRVAAYMPELQLTAIASYTMNTSFGSLSFQGEVSYADGFFTSISNFDLLKTDNYALTNLRATWTSPNNKYELRAFIENIFDETIIETAFDITAVGGLGNQTYLRPRWWGLLATVYF